MQDHRLSQKDALQFIVGGNALFTIQSRTDEKRFTYKVFFDKDNKEKLIVCFMNGPDNTRNYRKIGEITVTSGMPSYRATSIHTESMDCSVVFDAVFLNLAIGLDMPTIEVWHSGRCARCGRILTVPESIENGIGPECIFKQSFLKM